MKKVKVVYNACYGGFSLSRKAVERLIELGMESMSAELASHDEAFADFPTLSNNGIHVGNIERHDPLLIQVVEELEGEASGNCTKLAIKEISGNIYRIDEYDGNESVQEPDDIDWIVVS